MLPTFDRYILKKYNFFHFLCITGPSLPYRLAYSAMAESTVGRGVILFGGWNNGNGYKKSILELRESENDFWWNGMEWNILDKTLENGRYGHVVIPLQ